MSEPATITLKLYLGGLVKHLWFKLFIVTILGTQFTVVFAQADTSQTDTSQTDTSQTDTAQTNYSEYFDTVWKLVKERYWDAEKISQIWEKVKQEYKPQALAATNDDDFYSVLEAMYERIGDDHSTFVSPNKVEQIRSLYGDLPCFGIFSQHLNFEEISARNFNFTTLGNINYDSLKENIGYISLPDLATAFTPANVRSAVQDLEKQGVNSIILDLRGNPGGRLIEMMQVAGIFSNGFLWRILTRWTLPIPYPAVGMIETDLPLAILIDGNVNSAAEGLAGALQAKGRAVLFGETTAGNVEAVLPFCFRDGSQAWIATGVLAPLRGATWEGQGVVPDTTTVPEEALEAAVSYLLSLQN